MSQEKQEQTATSISLTDTPHQQDAETSQISRLAESAKLVGAVLDDRFEVLELIGHGGMGAVYRGRQISIDRPIAIKVLQAGSMGSHAAKRFGMEAKAAGSVTHPNLVTVHDYGLTPGGQPYLVMDLAVGTTLDKLIKQSGRIEGAQAISIFKQICCGLAYAHANGIIHRDLKPSNVIVSLPASQTNSERGGPGPGSTARTSGIFAAHNLQCKIVDFGIAKLIDQEMPQHLTQTGEICGSPYYMSPEQSLGLPIDQRSDVYSLGCLMYETLTGKVPFKGENAMQTLMKHVHDEAQPFAQVCPEASISADLEAIVRRAMARKADDRYASVDDISADLDCLTKGEPPAFASAAQAKKATKIKNSAAAVITKAAIGCLLILALCTIGGFIWLNTPRGQYIATKVLVETPREGGLGWGSDEQWLLTASRYRLQKQDSSALAIVDCLKMRGSVRNNPILFSRTLMETGRIYSDQKQMVLAKQMFLQACVTFVQEGKKEADFAVEAKAHGNYQALEQRANLAVEYFKLAQEPLEAVAGKNDFRVLQLLSKIAFCYSLEKHTDDAIAVYKDAIARARSNPYMPSFVEANLRKQLEGSEPGSADGSPTR